MSSVHNFEVKHRTYDFAFPATEPPSWAGEVERWYQLDAFAFGLPQAATYWGLPSLLKSAAWPSHLLLASPEGSNRTDADFARSFLKTGMGSPSKFVHTLPNSRSASLLQVLGWHGPLLCLQNDPGSIVEALTAAVEILADSKSTEAAPASPLAADTAAIIWAFAITRASDTQYSAHLFEVKALGRGLEKEGRGSIGAMARSNLENSGISTYFIQSSKSTQRLTHGGQALTDAELLEWLQKTSADGQVTLPALELNLNFQLSPNFVYESRSES